ncbi:response regulator transcription factor [Paenibacillus oceani]|uniref:Response regulator transcription factor n=1 Tax=Paenibacillus oceani TaxID=2772510 RepID=A0A927CA85_9BACL|nr:response regulator transcription factor [Paenibacillus oceani]MBD2864298.1 response regulator transcription factor [Paenibacillus oceani]
MNTPPSALRTWTEKGQGLPAPAGQIAGLAFPGQWLERLHELQRSESEACGLIAARIGRLSGERAEALAASMDPLTEGAEPIVDYSAADGLLAVWLPGALLASAHYSAMAIKPVLEQLSPEVAALVVTSFPESADPAAEALSEIAAMLDIRPARTKGEEADIELYVKPSEPDADSSIVVVDHNEELADLVRLRLELQGYDVHVAADGVNGLRLVEDKQPDLVLTELSLPGMDGYELIRRIRRTGDGTRRSKVMVLTGKGFDMDVQACFDMGVADYVRKPFSPIELEARIRRLLG